MLIAHFLYTFFRVEFAIQPCSCDLMHLQSVPGVVVGLFYRWQNDFTGIQFIRVGGGLSYLIDVKHALNFSYFVGFVLSFNYLN